MERLGEKYDLIPGDGVPAVSCPFCKRDLLLPLREGASCPHCQASVTNVRTFRRS